MSSTGFSQVRVLYGSESGSESEFGPGFAVCLLAERIHLCIKGLTIISFTNQEKLQKLSHQRCFGLFFDQIKIPKGKQNAETFFQRELLVYVLLLIINFMTNL